MHVYEPAHASCGGETEFGAANSCTVVQALSDRAAVAGARCMTPGHDSAVVQHFFGPIQFAACSSVALEQKKRVDIAACSRWQQNLQENCNKSAPKSKTDHFDPTGPSNKNMFESDGLAKAWLT